MQIEEVDQERGKGRKYGRGFAVLGLVIAFLAVILALTHRSSSVPSPSPRAPVVTVAVPLLREVSEWEDYVGRFASTQAVDVRPRISGAITAIHFRDGEMVYKGQLLFSVDRRPFAAALAEARANAASAVSALELAETDLTRAQRLSGDEALSGSAIDTLRARAQSAAASLGAARARVDQRALELEFTQIRAPISGRISDRRVDAGNLVSGEGATGTLLTTINASDPIYFSFNASEALFLKALRNRHDGGNVSVEIKLQDEGVYHWRGKLDFTDNSVDPRSGTIRGRAVLPNPKGFLTPGLFGRMRLASGTKTRALLVPDAAVQTDLTRKTVLVVATDGTVSSREVKLGPVVEGLRVVRSGLKSNDRVVISGIQLATPGGKVTVKRGRIYPRREHDAELFAELPLGNESYTH